MLCDAEHNVEKGKPVTHHVPRVVEMSMKQAENLLSVLNQEARGGDVVLRVCSVTNYCAHVPRPFWRQVGRGALDRKSALHIMHRGSHMTIDPRILTKPGRSV